MPLLIAKSTILVFGGQAHSFEKDAIRQLRSSVIDTLQCRWILDIIAELSEHWNAASQKVPKLQAIPSATHLQELNDWFKTGEVTSTSPYLPNILLGPLTQIAQLVQYSKYLELVESESREHRRICGSFNQKTTILGFCTGILGAIAASSAQNQVQLQEYGAVAIRLAMLVGGFTDAQHELERAHGTFASLATMWSSDVAGAKLQQIVDCFPEVM